MSDAVTLAVVAVVMALGLAGTVLPFIPGLGLIWLAGFVYGLVTGFDVLAIAVLGVMSTVGIAGALAGVLVPRRHAAASGAGPSSVWLGALFGVIGFFVVPVIGFLIGGVFGVYLGEQLRTGDRRVAWRRTRATLVGFGFAALVQLGAGTVMVLSWVVWVLTE